MRHVHELQVGPRRATLAAALALAALGGAGQASAATFCVNAPTCVGPTRATIQDALDSAAGNGGVDRVVIGPRSTPYTGPFSYTSNEKVTIEGAGGDRTVLTASSAPQAVVTLLSPTSILRGVTITIPDQAGGRGLRTSGTAEDVRIRHTGGQTSVTAVRLVGGAVLDGATVTTTSGTAVELAETVGSAAVRDSSISGGFEGIGVTGLAGASLDVLRSTVHGEVAITVGAASVDLVNSVVRSPGKAIYVLPGATVVVDHATIVGLPGDEGITVGTGSNAQPSSVSVSNSIVTGFTRSFRRVAGTATPANLTVQFSAYPETIDSSGPGALTQGAGVLKNGSIAFVLPSGFFPSYRLKAPSALIDAADPAGAAADDLAGAARPVDGNGDGVARRDIGAYEYQRQAPSAALSLDATLVGVGATVTGTSTSTDPDPGDVLQLAWDFGDGATAQGATASHAYATAGTFVVTLTATDPAGRSASATAQVEVSAAPVPPAPPPPPPPPPAPAGPTGGPALVQIESMSIRDAGRRLRLRLRCVDPATGACATRARLVATAKGKAVGVGSARRAIAVGTSARVVVVLNRTGRRLLATRGALRVRLVVVARDGAGLVHRQTVRMRLAPPRAT